MVIGIKVSFERDHKRLRGEVVEIVPAGGLPKVPPVWKKRYQEKPRSGESCVVKVADLYYWVDPIEFL